ncbi:hypothetical protein TBLA_0F01240 [Henningerozyma blattae CBS 6284]|uniref:ornithine decarboxylase n=1 Tax=Henningerozyma blattae (strain ATCC 34711 / CBS 6284 / DSM 70876 / NBRC 10599 / NRRL Y-10934 / UCD 77-7) TaxID=1071380 RepID=I2H5L5_HENB6|nr:hypothetical protein TBLA_0F01240 [Tetrapisispora blattae CBS 6284]CCH61667.1 hypothetical protein TBLA_0F01240 [Tetrapisispora blattae CBS 6284]
MTPELSVVNTLNNSSRFASPCCAAHSALLPVRDENFQIKNLFIYKQPSHRCQILQISKVSPKPHSCAPPPIMTSDTLTMSKLGQEQLLTETLLNHLISKDIATPLPHDSNALTLQSHKMIESALTSRLSSTESEDSFFVCDLGEIKRLYQSWRIHLPRVKPFYAVKCNPNQEILKTLRDLGLGFDCASRSEIDTVLSLDVSPERILYANPCKASSFIKHASEVGVLKSTFDNSDELYKIKRFHPNSELFIRIATDDESAQCRLSTKYGCHLDQVDSLLQTVKELELNLVGVAFHVGSGASDYNSLYKAIRDSKYVFNRVEEMGLPSLKVLDVGGGFQYHSFVQAAEVVNYSLQEFFPREAFSELQVIAEPGRYFVSTALTLATNVIAKRRPNNDNTSSMIYVNDGVYGNLNCILFDHQVPTPKILFHSNSYHYNSATSSDHCIPDKIENKISMWGPTCDGLDCIKNNYYLKYDLDVGDWIYFPNLGAYTSTAATQFNGFQQFSDFIYIDSEAAYN